MKVKKHYWHILLTATFIAISSCAPKHPDPPITVAANLWPGYDTFFMAETMDFYPEGSVHMVETPRSLALAQAIRGASIDAAAMSLSRAIELADKEVEISIVLVLDSSNGADAILAKPEIKTMQDLAGKRVAAEMDSISGYMFLRALEINNMTINDVKMSNIDNREMAARYERGELEAVAIYGYDRAKVSSLGATKLFDSSDIPGEIIDVLVVRDRFIEQYPNRVVDLIIGWAKTINHLNTLKPGQPLPEGAMNKQDYQDAKTGIKIWSPTENFNAFKNNGQNLVSILDSNIQHSIKLGFIEGEITPPSIDGSYLKLALNKVQPD